MDFVLACSSYHSGVSPLVCDILSYSRYRSLDCRHTGCFQCVLNWFKEKGAFCPKCNISCNNPPQYDISIESILFLLHKHTGGHHHTAESSGINPKEFDILYDQRRAALMASHATDPQTQASFVGAPWPTGFEGQTQAQVRTFDFSKRIFPNSIGGGTGEGRDLSDAAMDMV